MLRIFVVPQVLVLSFLFVLNGSAAIIRVPQDQPTIQGGIDAAVNGDTVLVADGIYTGSGNKNLDFNGKAITVKSENGPEAVIIDCENSGRGFYFHKYESNSSIVEGFTIQNGKVTNDVGGGIKIKEAGPIIRDNIVKNNKAVRKGGGAGEGGGISCQAVWDRPLIIENNIISNNEADQGGGGIFCSSSSPMIVNNLIIDNLSLNGSGGGIACKVTSKPRIMNNTFSGNWSGDYGGAFYIAQASAHPVITNTILWGNTAAHGGDEIYLHPGDDVSSFVTLSYTDIEGGFPGIVVGNIHRENIIWLEGNIVADPLFDNPFSGLLYDLAPGSLCINAGTANGAPNTDILGRPRPSGSGIDIGAYEQDDDASLAVELSLFTAYVVSDDIILKWRTESEIGNIGFAVYRNDQKIAFVSGAGNSAMPNDYQFKDSQAKPGQTYFYYIEDIDVLGNRNKSEVISITILVSRRVPVITTLLQNFPNPFNPETWIPFRTNKEARILIHNQRGQLVRSFDIFPSQKQVRWDGRNEQGEHLVSGVYFYTLITPSFRVTRKMVMRK